MDACCYPMVAQYDPGTAEVSEPEAAWSRELYKSTPHLSNLLHKPVSVSLLPGSVRSCLPTDTCPLRNYLSCRVAHDDVLAVHTSTTAQQTRASLSCSLISFLPITGKGRISKAGGSCKAASYKDEATSLQTQLQQSSDRAGAKLTTCRQR